MTTAAAQRIGANVRAEMARRGITQTELATRLGMSQPMLSKRLRGKTPFDVDELEATAAALGVDATRLLSEAA